MRKLVKESAVVVLRPVERTTMGKLHMIMSRKIECAASTMLNSRTILVGGEHLLALVDGIEWCSLDWCGRFDALGLFEIENGEAS